MTDNEKISQNRFLKDFEDVFSVLAFFAKHMEEAMVCREERTEPESDSHRLWLTGMEKEGFFARMKNAMASLLTLIKRTRIQMVDPYYYETPAIHFLDFEKIGFDEKHTALAISGISLMWRRYSPSTDPWTQYINKINAIRKSVSEEKTLLERQFRHSFISSYFFIPLSEMEMYMMRFR